MMFADSPSMISLGLAAVGHKARHGGLGYCRIWMLNICACRTCMRVCGGRHGKRRRTGGGAGKASIRERSSRANQQQLADDTQRHSA